MRKFMPYSPTMKVNGRKKQLITVRVFIISFIRSDFIAICSSRSPDNDSRNRSMESTTREI
ncbi:hypothetical protein D3C71_2063170 [compost metagenome]